MADFQAHVLPVMQNPPIISALLAQLVQTATQRPHGLRPHLTGRIPSRSITGKVASQVAPLATQPVLPATPAMAAMSTQRPKCARSISRRVLPTSKIAWHVIQTGVSTKAAAGTIRPLVWANSTTRHPPIWPSISIILNRKAERLHTVCRRSAFLWLGVAGTVVMLNEVVGSGIR